jgi:hypothetical protein
MLATTIPHSAVTPLRDRWRAITALAALVAAGAHVPVIGQHLREAPYMGVLFLLLTIACAILALALVFVDSLWTYIAAAAICEVAIAGYIATRSVAFPQLADDVGYWLEPLGILAVVSEAVVVGLSVRAVRRAPRVPRGARERGPLQSSPRVTRAARRPGRAGSSGSSDSD